MTNRRRFGEKIKNVILLILSFLLLFVSVILFLKLNDYEKIEKNPVIEKEEVKTPKVYEASIFMVAMILSQC